MILIIYSPLAILLLAQFVLNAFAFNVVVAETAGLAVKLIPSPPSGTAPLNNVDLTAYVSGTASGDIHYQFDCTSDGVWDRDITTSNNSYTATNLCNYSSPGSHIARTRVQREGLTVEGTAVIVVSL